MGQDLSTSILEKALSITKSGVYNYRLSGNSYSGDDLPHSSYSYESATIYWRNSEAITVVLFGISSTSK